MAKNQTSGNHTFNVRRVLFALLFLCQSKWWEVFDLLCLCRSRSLASLPHRLGHFNISDKLWRCVVEKQDIVAVEPQLGEVNRVVTNF